MAAKTEDDQSDLKKEAVVLKPVEEADINHEPRNSSCKKGIVKKGSWTPEEDQKLAEIIAINGPKRWKILAAKAGIKRSGKSCRFRWLNYLKPDIKRGNISDQEEDLILRLHELLGNRWSLIAGRLPGRTDNEIKNHWNSHLSKKNKWDNERKSKTTPTRQELEDQRKEEENVSRGLVDGSSNINTEYDVNDLFDFFNEGPNFEWVTQFFQKDKDQTWH